jgi:hypothetical protein
LLVMVALCAPSLARAKGDPIKKCAIAKRKAAAKMVAASLKCELAATAKGVPVSQSCLDAAAGQLTVAFAHIESHGSCPTQGNAPLVAQDVNLFVLQVGADVGSAGPTTTVGGSTTTTTLCAHCTDLGNGSPEVACPGSQALYDTLFTCVCSGPCAAPCNAACNQGQPADQPCQTCISDTGMGCGIEYQACQNDQ